MNNCDAAKLSASQTIVHLYSIIVNPLRGKRKIIKKSTSENQRLPFPDPILSVSSTALTMPLTSQAQISTSSAAPPHPLFFFISLSLIHLLFHLSLAPFHTQRTALENQLVSKNKLQLN